MKSDKEFFNRIKQDLDNSAEELDELTLARLGAARRRAVEVGSGGPRTFILQTFWCWVVAQGLSW